MSSTYNFTGTRWFVTDGNWYVSYRGSDSEGDGSPGKPFATIAAAIAAASTGEKIVIGSGQYGESINGGGKDCILEGDGYVEFNGTSATISNMGSNAALQNILFTTAYTFSNGLNKISHCFINQGVLSITVTTIEYCVFESGFLHVLGSTPVTMLKNCTFRNGSFIDSGATNRIENCHFDNIECSMLSIAASYFDYCSIDGATFEFSAGNAFSTADIISFYPAYMAHGIDASAGYNDTGRGDYTITAASALRFAGSDGRFIGAHGMETIFKSTTLTSPTLTNISLTAGGNYNVTISGQLATIETGTIDLGSTRQLGIANLYASMLFLVNELNFAVDDSLLPSIPELLTFSLRHSDNIKLVPKATYKQYRWQELITDDATGKGNGDAAFDRTTELAISARYVQFKITMSDTTFYLLQQSGGRINQEDNSGSLLHTNV